MRKLVSIKCGPEKAWTVDVLSLSGGNALGIARHRSGYERPFKRKLGKGNAFVISVKEGLKRRRDGLARFDDTSLYVEVPRMVLEEHRHDHLPDLRPRIGSFTTIDPPIELHCRERIHFRNEGEISYSVMSHDYVARVRQLTDDLVLGEIEGHAIETHDFEVRRRNSFFSVPIRLQPHDDEDYLRLFLHIKFDLPDKYCRARRGSNHLAVQLVRHLKKRRSS